MVNKRVLFGVFVLLAVALSALVSAQQPATNEAETSIHAAYQNILSAYQAGADTTQLITQINQALNLTQQANLLQETEPKQAQELISQAQTIVQNVTLQAQVVEQSALALPAIEIVGIVGLLVAGVLTYVFGPRLLWRLWFKLRKNYRVVVTNSKSDSKALVITPQRLCGVVLALCIFLSFVAVSGVLMPTIRGEPFSELGILGPNMTLGDYPSVVVVTESVHLNVYVGNQMGKPMFYTVILKLGDNNTQTNPADLTAIQVNHQVLANNQTWTYPVDVTLDKVGDNQRLIFELWVYNETTHQNQYHERWGQVWINVTAPAT